MRDGLPPIGMLTAMTLIVACTAWERSAPDREASDPEAGPAPGREESPLVQERLSRVESAVLPALRVAGEPLQTAPLPEVMEELGVPGVSIAVLADGELEWARGYGMADVEGGRPVTAGTLFQAASISKPVAAMAALKLVQDGALGLDQDVDELLTSWKLPDGAWTAAAPVTLRRLLSHTAGTTVHGFPGYERSSPIPDTVGVLEGRGNTDAVRVDVEPGSLWRYSGGGYTLAQLLLTDVSGEPFPGLLQRTVLEPLGMTDSTYEQPLPADLHARAASGYGPGGQKVPGDWHVYPEMAAAGLWTTPSDLARWALSIQKAVAGKEHPVLSRDLVVEMLTPGRNGYGLGPGTEADGARFGHGGSNAGFRCLITAFRDGRGGVAVMTNSATGDLLARRLLYTVAEVYGWEGLEPPLRETTEIAPEALEAAVGRYESERFGGVTIAVRDGRLWIELPWGTRTELLPVSGTEFFQRLDGTGVRFVREGEEVTGLVWAGAVRARRIE